MKRKNSIKPPDGKFLPNLYLAGFMGTGKSVIGKRIAAECGLKFLDSDSEIEKKYGLSVHDIFLRHGEKRFREMEKEFIECGHPEHSHVIACGGGLVCADGMAEVIKKKGLVIVLFADAELILKRVSGSRKRPLLNVENPLERIKNLMEERKKFYLNAGVCVSTGGRISEAQDRVARIYKDYAKKHLKNNFPRLHPN